MTATSPTTRDARLDAIARRQSRLMQIDEIVSNAETDKEIELAIRNLRDALDRRRRERRLEKDERRRILRDVPPEDHERTLRDFEGRVRAVSLIDLAAAFVARNHSTVRTCERCHGPAVRLTFRLGSLNVCRRCAARVHVAEQLHEERGSSS